MQVPKVLKHQNNRSNQSAFTVVELVVAIVVSGIVLVGLVSLVLTLTNQYAISSVRSNLTSGLVKATRFITSDVKDSRNVLTQNDIADAAAPSGGNWSSTSSQLVLAATARNTDGESVDGTYPGNMDNIIYYLRSGSLYRRLLAYNHASNRYTTITCTPLAGGGCLGDTNILDNVSSMTITYLDENGSTAASASAAISVNVVINLSVQQSGQAITSSSEFTSTLFK